MNFTWAQFRSYLRLARRRKAEQDLMQFIATGHAFAGGDGAKALLRGLNDQLKAAQAED